MAAIGETLRQARLRLGVDLNQVADKTKISLRFLQAIEADDYGKLPGGVFARMFVKQYADELGLDGASLAEEFQRSTNFVEPQPDLQTIVEARSTFQPKLQSFDSVSDRVRSERLNSMLSSLIWFVAVVLVCSGAYYGFNHLPKHFTLPGMNPPETAEQSQTPKAEAPKAEPQAQSTQPPATAPSPAPDTTTPSGGNAPASPTGAPPAATAPAQTAAAGQPAPAPGAGMELSLVATDKVWLSATADGKSVFSGILESGNSKIITASAKARLNIGNAGGLIVTCNGKKYDPFGPAGQVRTVEFTPEGAQVVSRTPPPNPDPLR
jgi:cytoskeleton protein RodZ